MKKLESLSIFCRRFKKIARSTLINKSLDLRVQRLRQHSELPGNKHVYYLIYRENTQAGFFSNLYVFFPEIIDSIDRGEIPVVDMLHFRNQTSRKPSDNVNYWELIYEQPLGHGLDSAYQSKRLNHSYGCRNDNQKRLQWNMQWSCDSQRLRSLKTLFNSLVRLKPDVNEHIKSSKSIVFQDFSRTIGVSLRGTDYVSQKPYGHPVQPCIESILNKCSSLMDSEAYDSVYLASIDQDIHSAFKSRFGSKLVCYERKLYSSLTKNIIFDVNASENLSDHYLAYVTSVYLFRYCKHVVGGITSSTIFLPLIVEDDVSFDFPFLGFYD